MENANDHETQTALTCQHWRNENGGGPCASASGLESTNNLKKQGGRARHWVARQG
jgi:hypothetical protein